MRRSGGATLSARVAAASRKRILLADKGGALERIGTRGAWLWLTDVWRLDSAAGSGMAGLGGEDVFTPLVGFYGTPGHDVADAVLAWFRRTGGGSLYLSGEPYSLRPDSLFDATYVAQRQHQLVLELNGWLLLVFNVVPQVHASRNMLTLTGHSQCLLFEPRGESTSAKVRVYRDQEVSFGGGAVWVRVERVDRGLPRVWLLREAVTQAVCGCWGLRLSPDEQELCRR